MEEAGVPVEESLIVPTRKRQGRSGKIAGQERPDGYFCFNDVLACVAIQAAE